MKLPGPPFLEFNFYFAELSRDEALLRLVTALVQLGATFTSAGVAHRGADVRDRVFAGINDMPLEPLSIADIQDLRKYRADPNLRIIQVFLNNATAIELESAEIITCLSVSSAAAVIDQHPLAIWTSGSWVDWQNFSGALREKYAQIAERAGSIAYQRFRVLTELLHPDYAAITVEEGLKCPTDLALNPQSTAFRDFFLNGMFTGESKLREVQELYRGAYTETIGNGVYISTNAYLNPDSRSLAIGYVLQQSIQVSKLIGALAR